MRTKYWWKNLKGGDHPEDQGVDGRLELILRKCLGWIHVARDRDRWLTLVNTIMNLRVP
jgi:hypothetical protein